MQPDDVPLSGRAERLAEGFVGWPRRRVWLVDLWRLLLDADPGMASSSDRRHRLASALDELSRVGRIALPAAGSWDRSERPPLPRFIKLPRSLETPKAARIVWRPELAWVLREPRLTPGQRERLAVVNAWLHRHRDDLVVPMRERSLEIFGDEKALDDLVRSSLFTADRLSLDLLRARRAVPRLTVERVGTGNSLLVIENSDTFDTLVKVLARSPGRVGLVGWGAGGGFEASVLSIPSLGTVTEILYFGDVDRRGLEIPASADRLARSNELPPVRPANALYRMLVDLGRPQDGQPRLGPDRAQELTSWLPDDLSDPVSELLVSGQRLAQEAVGLTQLRGMTAEQLGL